MKEFDFQIKYGAAIRDARQHCEMSQPELAKILGVTKQAVSSWELDRTSPTREIREKIISSLCLPGDYFADYLSTGQYALTRIEDLMTYLDDNAIDSVIAYGNYLKMRRKA